MNKAITINLSELMAQVRKYKCSTEFGFVGVADSSDRVYISPNTLSLFIYYSIYKVKGHFLQAQIINDLTDEIVTEVSADIEEIEDDEEVLIPSERELSVADILGGIELSGESGIYIDLEQSYVPSRQCMLVLEHVNLNQSDDAIIADIRSEMCRAAGALFDISPNFYDNKCNPQYIYLGYIPDYEQYRRLLVRIGVELNTTLYYYNQQEYDKIKSKIDTENMQRQYQHILTKFDPAEIFEFSATNKFVHQFQTNNSDFRQRELKQKIFQTKEFYEWIIAQDYKVYTFSSDMSTIVLDNSFYTALALAQQQKGVKVFMYNMDSFNQLMTTLVNMPYADFYSRLCNYYSLYQVNSFRILTNQYGHSSLARIKQRTMNVTFKGINISKLSKFIPRDEAGLKNPTIMLDDYLVKDDTLEVLTNTQFRSYQQAGYSVKPYDALKLLQVTSKLEPDADGFMDKRFEHYVYMVCRLLDQLVGEYQTFTTIRNLAAFAISSEQDQTVSWYIGIGTMDPEVTCDMLILNHEGLLIADCPYKGDAMDIAWLDDLEEIDFYKNIDSPERVGFLDKVKIIYENSGIPYDPDLDNYATRAIKPQTTEQLFMGMVYGSCYTSSVKNVQSIYSLTKSAAYRTSEDNNKLSDMALAPIYFGLAMPRNYLAFKYMLPVLLEHTTSYGYRQVPAADSVLNIFGGLNFDAEFNLWFYPELFQHHQRNLGKVEGEIG